VSSSSTFSAHALVSEVPMPGAHLRLLKDTTPLDASGVPLYQPVWDWMLTRFLPAHADIARA
jgi:hypothetical protein